MAATNFFLDSHCGVRWSGNQPTPLRQHVCKFDRGHRGNHVCKHCPATKEQIFQEKPVEVTQGPYKFSTPADLDAVHDAEVTRCAAFLAHIIQDRLSQETTGAREIGMVLQPKDAPVDQRFHLSIMADAIERLSNDLYASGWMVNAEPRTHDGNDRLIITLSPMKRGT